MPTRNAPNPEPEAQASAVTEEQVKGWIAEAIAAGKPQAPEAPAGPPAVSDSDYDAMTDRQRESHVRQLVDSILGDLARDDEIARQRADIDNLKKDQRPEPEAPPSVVTKIQKWLWGEPDK